MTHTALAAGEPEPPRFATGGIVTGPGLTPGTDGCVWPNGPRTVAYPAGNVSVTIDLDALSLAASAPGTWGCSFGARLRWPGEA